MKIAAVIVTCNRLELLPIALRSIKNQTRQPDYVYIVSNSTSENFYKEQKLCSNYDFLILENQRTKNYAGALNTAVEELTKVHDLSEDLYFASLDDDDEWLFDYLQELEYNNTNKYDLLVGHLLRYSSTENNLLVLPDKLSEKDFLIGNPGITGSNTFIKLTTLLKAGAFDEGLPATIDRDFLVRVFLQKPTYKIIPKHLVTQHTDNNRERVTTNQPKKAESLRIFFYKYQHLMNAEEKEFFFQRAEKLFSVNKKVFEYKELNTTEFSKGNLSFHNKGNYQLVIGFITSNEVYSKRILNQISDLAIPADLVLIINNSKGNSLAESKTILLDKCPCRIVQPKEWKANLQTEQYGKGFAKYTEINSIPLGRTILHYHLHNETLDFERPVYWIIDDDITFNFVTDSNGVTKDVNLLEIINENITKTDAIIGSVTNDPPLPFLSSTRTQLIDLLHSHWANNSVSQDILNLRKKDDYYYDLSDRLSNHLEIPIYHQNAHNNAIDEIFSGKAISRKVIQKPVIRCVERIVSQRGPNTLVLNRDLLHYYPVINIRINNKFARRGDLLWVLFNQIISEYKIIEHTYSIQQNRVISPFDINRELEKSAYDIIGYAFNKGLLETIQEIKKEAEPNRPKDIFNKLETEYYFDFFFKVYKYYLRRRKARFLMNYYRIIGLIDILAHDFTSAKSIAFQISNTNQLETFLSLTKDAEKKVAVKQFINEITFNIWSYSNAITKVSQSALKHKQRIESALKLQHGLRLLGNGSEGIVFTDEIYVYKSFFDITNKSWLFLKKLSVLFSQCDLLEKITFFEMDKNKIIRYPFHQSKSLQNPNKKEIISLLKFCKKNNFIFTNISPKNFIQTHSGKIKLIDYGKSFEPYTKEKFENASKRAFLLLHYPTVKDDLFKKYIKKINSGENFNEIKGWEAFHEEVIF